MYANGSDGLRIPAGLKPPPRKIEHVTCAFITHRIGIVAPLLCPAQLIPSSNPMTGSTGSGRENEGKYTLLTSLKPDSWLVHICRPDGRMAERRMALKRPAFE